MTTYQAISTNRRNLTLTLDGQPLGELLYEKWYSFDAEIALPDGHSYQLQATGFLDSKIELKEDTSVLLEFKMGWKGIHITTFFDSAETNFLVKSNGFWGSKFVLLNAAEEELLTAETDFQWSKLACNHTLEASPGFDVYAHKELLLLTMLHCINYYLTVIAGGA